MRIADFLWFMVVVILSIQLYKATYWESNRPRWGMGVRAYSRADDKSTVYDLSLRSKSQESQRKIAKIFEAICVDNPDIEAGRIRAAIAQVK